MLRLFLFALLSLSGIAQADTMLRFDKGVVEVGDKTGRVLTIAGKPDRIVPIENKFGQQSASAGITTRAARPTRFSLIRTALLPIWNLSS